MTDEVTACSIPGCDEPAREGQRYCAPCHAKYMRGWRARKKLEQEQLVEEVFRLRKLTRELKDQLKTAPA